ncbi:MAG: selenium cofactor biosynthesis protein YqeC [Anaeromicrobium sp.]|jgi:probable selenium-dependent hydroxylase accessory protein YqeC|uniref:selenium cofactor biosynthesis protein YqeC n=1 Tax=Anaeromicrobium sp. TaxID=1929132 RepID=UPI0025FF1972|nr:selenium cofactor biosynthesis protein YqeC [Anaeromicrobium sp.]MCT4592878.1 selenium cofactor biosynthesis protein YqeC [Anaeromicrobium sp.]
MRLIDSFSIKRGEMITLVGGGGKTTSLLNMVDNYFYRNILISTTTKIYEPPYKFVGINEFNYDKGPLSIGRYVNEEGKVVGVDKHYLDRIYNKNIYDLILVEGDGSKGRSLKLYRENEPIIPPNSKKLIIVMGADIVGKKFNEKNVHRYSLSNKEINIKENHILTIEKIYEILTSTTGVIGKIPSNMETYFFINKCDKHMSEEIIKLGKRISKLNIIDKVIYGSAKNGQVYKELIG